MEYIVKDKEGKTQGPVGQQTLREWVKEGKVKKEDQVRNALIDRWEDASKVSCLKEVFKSVQPQGGIKKDSFFKKVKATATTTVSDVLDNQTIIDPRNTFKYTAPPMIIRFFAFITDLVFISVIFFICYAIGGSLAKSGNDVNTAFYISFFIFYIASTMYFAWFLGFRAQTFGQLYWGIMITKKSKGKPVFLGRAYVYTLFLLLFGWLTPLMMFINPSKRSIQEILSDTRIICTRNRE